MGGFACSSIIVCHDAEGKPPMAFRTLMLQEMVRGSVLIPYISPSLAHDASAIDKTLRAVEQMTQVYKRAMAEGVDAHVEGPHVQPVFRRYA